jgi:hypothetical protein
VVVLLALYEHVVLCGRHVRENVCDHGHGGGYAPQLHLIELVNGHCSKHPVSAFLPVDVPLDDTPASFSSFFTPPICRSLDSAPAAWMQACGSSLKIASRFSFAPLGDPGKVKMRVCLRTPATGLAMSATVQYWLSCQNSEDAYKHGVTAYELVSMPWLVEISKLFES